MTASNDYDLFVSLLQKDWIRPALGRNMATYQACREGATEILQELLLLKGEKEVDSAADQSLSIRVASEYGHVDVVRLLLTV